MNFWVVSCVSVVLAACVPDDASRVKNTTVACRPRRKPVDLQQFLHLLLDLGSGSSSSSSLTSSMYDSDSRALEDPGSAHRLSPPRRRYDPPADADAGVLGGAAAEYAPYVVQLGREGAVHCNGVILSLAWVITTATCAHSSTSGQQIPVQDLTMRVGAARRDTGGAVYRVIRVELYPSFDYATHDYDYDFALLQVRGSGIAFSPAVQPISLPERELKIPANAEAVVSGWGGWSMGEKWNDNLQCATVRIVTDTDCVRAFLAPPVTSRMFCAGDVTRGPCQGDPGAPLVLNGTLAGLSSWGYERCSLTGHPGVYGRVADLEIRDWIRRTTNI